MKDLRCRKTNRKIEVWKGVESEFRCNAMIVGIKIVRDEATWENRQASGKV
jgi:hypothetical protein